MSKKSDPAIVTGTGGWLSAPKGGLACGGRPDTSIVMYVSGVCVKVIGEAREVCPEELLEGVPRSFEARSVMPSQRVEVISKMRRNRESCPTFSTQSAC